MGIEVINLNKMPFHGWHVQNKIILFDQDDFQFITTSVLELAVTKYGERTGIKRFCDCSDVPYLKPNLRLLEHCHFFYQMRMKVNTFYLLKMEIFRRFDLNNGFQK